MLGKPTTANRVIQGNGCATCLSAQNDLHPTLKCKLLSHSGVAWGVLGVRLPRESNFPFLGAAISSSSCSAGGEVGAGGGGAGAAAVALD